MKTMLGFILLLAMVLLEPSHARAQTASDSFPRSMLGFFEKGTHLSLQNMMQGPGLSEYVVIQILDQEAWTIAQDARRLSTQQLREKYPIVEAHARETLASFDNASKQATVEVSVSRERPPLLVTVIHVGDDYLLVSYGEGDEKRRVLPKHLIKSITWGDGVPNLTVQYKSIDAGPAKPSDQPKAR